MRRIIGYAAFFGGLALSVGSPFATSDVAPNLGMSMGGIALMILGGALGVFRRDSAAGGVMNQRRWGFLIILAGLGVFFGTTAATTGECVRYAPGRTACAVAEGKGTEYAIGAVTAAVLFIIGVVVMAKDPELRRRTTEEAAEAETTAAGASPGPSATERLEELARLRDQGLLAPEEFEAKRQEIVAEL